MPDPERIERITERLDRLGRTLKGRELEGLNKVVSEVARRNGDAETLDRALADFEKGG